MSHHGLQVLYSLMNAADWACERAFTPLPDFEAALREHGLPLYSLETFTPLAPVRRRRLLAPVRDLLHERADDARPRRASRSTPRTAGADDTLVIAGGPGAQNPELLAPFIDLFVIGDGEPSLPVVCELWKAMQGDPALVARRQAGADRRRACPGPTSPASTSRSIDADGTIAGIHRLRDDVPAAIKAVRHRRPRRHPAADRADRPVRRDGARPDRHRDHARVPLAVPVLPEHGHQAAARATARSRRSSTPRSRATTTPATTRSACSRSRPATIPHFEELVTRMSEVFTPAGREDLAARACGSPRRSRRSRRCWHEGRRGGLTLAPEVARDDMREQIRKPIDNQDLYDGAAEAFRRGWRKVKLYFMCGLPGERPADLDGIVEMAETIARIGKEVTGRYAEVDGQRLQLRPQAAHALPVERHAGRATTSTGRTTICARGSRSGRSRSSATTSRRACSRAS